MTHRYRFLVALLLVLLGTGCALNVTPTQPKVCLDNQPPKLILNDACKDGVCGYTCEPGRWTPVHLIIDDRPLPRAPLGAAGGS
jgi:hypothetical protein